MMVAEPIFIDTNVLVYVTRKQVAQHSAALSALRAIEVDARPAWISRQVIREYIATMTRPDSLLKVYTGETVVQEILQLEENFYIADETAEVTRHLMRLMIQFSVKGRQVHDANIVATMLAYQVKRLLTFNVADFRRFEPLIAIEPLP